MTRFALARSCFSRAYLKVSLTPFIFQRGLFLTYGIVVSSFRLSASTDGLESDSTVITPARFSHRMMSCLWVTLSLLWVI